ncbi:aminotransferase class V-fold PLP-dependent enzyme [Bacillus cereus]|uniref:aminotransferase class V-fold PLP-dependent enzyme n=1 Tax=Bacillus cereus group TaxID=86661 RepID=UPI000BF33106|nr:aminotransferase class V-fold PLP-dependent enzyme [Bacillus thuringiensis]MCU5543063.1 aminotransferase class V-fold PLP-dependent enzyme [Bacillus cereus]MED3358043.1 aminotransferase class V-fold PLP-dependent enzyme [Bacillus thuringiensis]PFW03860.1 dTDP-4-dehydro-6-deoxy-D-glucose 4-aminotransferase [Bacillus thuringiensis]PGU27081.1 dTDP-4-dehydro-6-deoxy-D-glucose 4-aminotransferase [Bacillus thuringiensis]HDR4895580.1 DegT/DnrJ/EryC1/StrS aminotransferase family protein [Bacillus c
METQYLYPKNPKKIKYPIYSSFWSISDHVFFLKSVYRPNDSNLKKNLQDFYPDAEIILTNSGTSALVVGLKYLKVAKGDEVILSNFNCPNVIEAILTVGATPVLIDLNTNHSISLNKIKKHLNANTKAIILTHLYGCHDDLEIIDWARENNIYIIDDAAQAMFSYQNGKPVGSLGDIGILSFGGTKPIPSIGGGALLLNRTISELCDMDEEKKEEVILDYKNHLKTQFAIRIKKSRVLSLFTNYWRKLEILPFYNNSKLDSLPEKTEVINPKRMSIVRSLLIDKHLQKTKKILEMNICNASLCYTMLQEIEEKYGVKIIFSAQNVYLNYFTIIFKEPSDRYECSVHLAEKGIQTCWNYLPLSEIPIFSKYATESENIDFLWPRVLSIPFKYPLVNKDLKYICSQILKYLENKN